MFLRDTAAQMMEDQVVEFREKFVNQNLGRTRGTERVSVAPSPIRPIYVRKVKRGPLSVLAAELRSVLPEQCVRRLSFYEKTVWRCWWRNLWYHSQEISFPILDTSRYVAGTPSTLTIGDQMRITQSLLTVASLEQ